MQANAIAWLRTILPLEKMKTARTAPTKVQNRAPKGPLVRCIKKYPNTNRTLAPNHCNPIQTGASPING